MSRIQRAFERRFRELFAELGARDRGKGIRWVFAQAKRRMEKEGISLSHALAEQNIALAEQAHRFRERKGLTRRNTFNSPVFCDAGLGGLARWLRATGCDAHWIRDISDSELVAAAERIGAVIITTDSFLLDRRPIVSGLVRAIWVPPTLTKFEQLRLVRAELDLAAQGPTQPDSRCMRCGGELVPVEKESVKERIPPKTYLWVNDYYRCTRCGQLFWEGTHWQRVTERLKETV